MKSTISLTVAVLFCLFGLSCSNDDNGTDYVEPSDEINVSVFYKKQSGNKIYPDVGSVVYIYFDIDSSDLFGSTYEGDGKFIKNDKEYLPDQTGVIDGQGQVVLKSMYLDRPFTVVTISNYYKDRISSTPYSGKYYPIHLTVRNNS